MRLRSTLSLLLLFGVISGPWAYAVKELPTDPMIESIEGDEIVIVVNKKGNHVARTGYELKYGDRVRTGPHASAKIRYPDGSKLLVGKGTEIEIQEKSEGTSANTLHRGQVRGLIRSMRNKEASEKPKFIIRSRSAVMGVRGTDFVFEVGSKQKDANLHTLEGVVEVAKDEPTLLQGKGVRVGSGESIVADQKQIGRPQTFDRSAYAQRIDREQPHFVSFVAEEEMEIIASTPLEDDQPREEEKPYDRWSLVQFGTGVSAFRQETGGEFNTGELTWTPVFRLFRWIGLRGHAGLILLKDRVRGEPFYMVETGLLGSLWLLDPLVLEFGPVFQHWKDRQGPGIVPKAVASFNFGPKAVVSRVYVSASAYELPWLSLDGRNHIFMVQFSAGVGVTF